MAPLTAQQVQDHPSFKTANFLLDIKPTNSGLLPVAEGRGGPINISWETHGHGPIHLVYIMGLGAFKTSWQRSCKHFGHDRGDQYTCLVFDNRGMGGSDKPLMRYSTSEMAKDLIEVCDAQGWTAPRDLHVIGISMGGCIAQEVAYAIPERIASLTLISTFPRLIRTTGFVENIRNRSSMFMPKHIDKQLAQVKRQLWSEEWLNKPDEQLGIFPTNGDWFTAAELNKQSDTTGAFTVKGFVLQAIACGWHHKSDAQLKEMGEKIGHQRIHVLTGDVDRMIDPIHSKVILAGLGGEEAGVTYVVYPGVSHVPIVEKRYQYLDLQEKLVQKAVKLNRT